MVTKGRLSVIALVILALGGVVAAPDRADVAPPAVNPPQPSASGPQEVEILAVMLDPRSQAPAILLQGKRDKRNLLMSIGPAEATGIAVPLQGITPPRPLTHDLFLTLFGRFKISVERVVITDLRDDIFYATLYLTTSNGPLTLDSRPSDAIALALRAKAPVLVEDRVFEKGGTQPSTSPPRNI